MFDNLFSGFNGILGFIWFCIVIYTIYLLIVGRKPKNLNKLVWIIIIIFIPVIGVILYWIFEKNVLK